MKKIYFLLLALMAGIISFAQTVPNAGMETWRTNSSGSGPTVPVYAPESWYGFDSLIIEDEENFLPLAYLGYHPSHLYAQLYQENTIKNSGLSSAKIMTLRQDTIGLVPGSLSNAKIGINVTALISGGTLTSATTFSGGTAVSLKITSVSAYVKY